MRRILCKTFYFIIANYGNLYNEKLVEIGGIHSGYEKTPAAGQGSFGMEAIGNSYLPVDFILHYQKKRITVNQSCQWLQKYRQN